ncbi:MAG: hypothetical protein HFH80_00175 [Lachnospiraceae bacterium]|nr:hypothetical protein [Lachnospiraceae bacterium]
MITIEELQRMKEADIMQADRDQLVDINSIEIDKNRSVESRIRNYLEQVGNPFLVKTGEYILKFTFADCDKDMDDRMVEYVSRMSKIRC